MFFQRFTSTIQSTHAQPWSINGPLSNKRSPLAYWLGSLLLILALGILAVPGAQGQCFTTATNFGVGSRPFAVAVGDFNADGRPDLATANQGSNNVSVLLGQGNGSFAAATNFGVGSTPQSIAVGDFNADSKPDLAVANQGSNNVSVLLGQGNGSFTAATNFVVGSGPNSVAVGDFNADGKPDLAVTNLSSKSVSVLLGQGNGSFTAATNFAVGFAPFSVAVGDFNADGKLDMAVANNNSNTISVLLGQGNGNFTTAVDYPVGSAPESIAVGDFNADGKPDLAFTIGSGSVSVLLGNGDGSFGTAANFGVGNNPIGTVVGDFTGDGKLDLAVANINSTNVSVLPGQGNGRFGAAINFTVGSASFDLAVGDFNADGKPDLAAAILTTNNVAVLINTTTRVSLVSQPPSGSAVCAGSSVSAPVSVSGIVTSYQWYKDGSPLTSQTSATLTLPNAQTTDQGSYSVVVTGACNSLTSSAFNLTVNTPPTRLYVNANASGKNTGLSWKDAFTDLQSALRYTCAQNLTEIWVAAGTYKPTTTTGPDSRTISFAMKNGIAIYGGFMGVESALSDRPPINPLTGYPSNSTLSGDIGTVGNTGDNSYHIISNNGLNSSAKLDGFVIVGGNNSDFGGGGGAIYNSNSSPTLINCSFTGNQAYNGGVINNEGTSIPTLTNSSFTSNTATNGGALFGNATLTNCLFSDNTASQAGGAIYAGSSLSVTSCSFQGNQATGNGGGIFNDGGSMPITNSSFTSNTATNGGALFGSGALTNCSFINNMVSQWGGGIYAGSSLNVASCSFQGNQAPNGFGGAIVGNATLTNSVFWGNGGTKTLEGSSFSPTYCLLDNLNNVNLSGLGNLITTSSPFVSTTSVALIACAPAINAGNPATTSATVSNIDLAGNPRFYNNGPIDMGAVEFQGGPFAVSAGSSLPQANVGVTLSLTASGATTYQWTAPSSAPLTGPANASITSASLTTAGIQTFTVVGTSGVCSQTALLSLTALAGPDLSPLINLPSGNFTPNQTKALLVQLQEVNGAAASGPILITITVPSGYSVSFDNSLTSIQLEGSTPTPVFNSKWQISSSVGSQQLRLSLNSGESVSPRSTMNLGVFITRTTANGGSFSNITVNVADDSGGGYDVNRLNNIYARIINGL